MAEKRCYTVKEIQEMLGVGRVTVYELLKQGELRYVIVGGKYLVSKKSFDHWLDADASDPDEDFTMATT